jgi:hypothetical protein
MPNRSKELVSLALHIHRLPARERSELAQLLAGLEADDETPPERGGGVREPRNPLPPFGSAGAAADLFALPDPQFGGGWHLDYGPDGERYEP